MTFGIDALIRAIFQLLLKAYAFVIVIFYANITKSQLQCSQKWTLEWRGIFIWKLFREYWL